MYLLLILAVVTSIWAYITHKKYFQQFEEAEKYFPGDPTLPFFGNIFDLCGDGFYIYNYMLQKMREFKRSYRIWLGPHLLVVLITAEDCEKVLNNNKYLKKSYAYRLMSPLVGQGLITSNGSKWRRHRKVLNPAFHSSILEDFLDIFNNNAAIASDILRDTGEDNDVNIEKVMCLVGLDNICETTMGININAQHNENNEYNVRLKETLDIILKRLLHPWLMPDCLFKWTKYAKIQENAIHYSQTFSKNVITAKIEERKQQKNENKIASDSGTKRRRALLDLALDLYDEGFFSFEEVQEEVDTFMTAGHETTSTTMAFALFSLANHPEYQEKVYQEQKEIFGDDDRFPTMADLKQMKYLKMVINETLRFYTTVPHFGRELEEPLRLDSQRVIPTGCSIFVLSASLHRDPKNWEKPEEFYPDHFLPEAVAKRHPSSFVPFSSGPRNCIGMKFAMNQMKATISWIVRHLKLFPAKTKSDMKLAIGIVLTTKEPCRIRVERRM